jgi:hypothetical protein
VSFCDKTGSNWKIQTWCWLPPKNLKEAGIINRNHEEVERKTKTQRKENLNKKTARNKSKNFKMINFSEET